MLIEGHHPPWDIKPSNILVTSPDIAEGSELGTPTVIDFGIAKATRQELTDKTVVTQFQQFLGTLAYISPEQALVTSDDIDTRSDILFSRRAALRTARGHTAFRQSRAFDRGPRRDAADHTGKGAGPSFPAPNDCRDRPGSGLDCDEVLGGPHRGRRYGNGQRSGDAALPRP
ncbi:MAG: hypothetical protein U1G07_16490 [Verrucomicrobiota bacterium]